jgi:hypothetical protein
LFGRARDLLLRELRGLHEPGGVGDLRLHIDGLDGRLDDLGYRVVVVRARLRDRHDCRVGKRLRIGCCAADQRECTAGYGDGGGTPP